MRGGSRPPRPPEKCRPAVIAEGGCGVEAAGGANTNKNDDTMKVYISLPISGRDIDEARRQADLAAAVTEMRHCMGLVLREHRRWTPEERLRLRRMRMEGISYATAALVLDRTAGAAAKQFRDHVKGKYI